MKMLAAFVLALVMAGCATYSTGSKVDDATFAQVKKGMTQSEVKALLGEPTSVVQDAVGGAVWYYSYTEAKPGAMAYVPYASLFGNHTDTKSSTRSIMFNSKGLVTDQPIYSGSASSGK